MPFFAVMQKKIMIPNNAKVRTLSWNLSGCGVMAGSPADHDAWLAAGCDDAVLKVMKLDAQASGESNVRGVAAPTALKMNSNPLTGHKGAQPRPRRAPRLL
jgi:hypothetical protein